MDEERKKEKHLTSRSTKWPKTMMRRLLELKIILLLLIVVMLTIGCGPPISPQASELIDSIHVLLISEKLCKDKNDCRTKRYILQESTEKKVYINLYGITDKTVIKKIIGLCIDAHTKNPEVRYELFVHPLRKEEVFVQGAILKLILPEEK